MNPQMLMAVAITLLSAIMSFSLQAQANSNYPIAYDNDIAIPTLLDPADRGSPTVYLPANIYYPISENPDELFPAIIFISSWALNEHEYSSQARNLARQGYVVLSYTARGFYNSPGLISTAGPEDSGDGSAAIDFLLDTNNRYPVEPDALALAGVSYGAGIALITGFQDDRVKAIVAMSAWVDLIESLWGGNTPNFTWIEILIAASRPIPLIASNNPSPEITDNYANMKLHKNIESTKRWGRLRSAASYFDDMILRGHQPAIYIANNLHDYLFQPDPLFDLLGGYDGAWRLDLSRGVHGSGEAGGLLGDSDHLVWANANLWFDRYLKGSENGIDQSAPFSTKVLNTGIRESYWSLHPEDEMKVFNLIPDAGAMQGQLSTVNANDVDQRLSFTTAGRITWAGGVAGAYMHTGRTLDTQSIDPNTGLVFTTPILQDPLRIRGKARVELTVAAEDKAQYFGYLFFLHPDTGIANWVGHAPFSCHRSEGCATGNGELEQITLDFYWTSVDIPAGTQLMLVIDGRDPDYWRYADTPETNTVVFDAAQQATLSLPIVSSNTDYDDPTTQLESNPDPSRGLGNTSNAFVGQGSGGAITWWEILLIGVLVLGGYILQSLPYYHSRK